MLRQDINLYTAFKSSSPVLEILTWKQMVLSSVGFLLLLIFSYILSISDLFYKKYELHSLNNDIVRLQSQFEYKKSHYPSFFFSDNVAKVVADQEKDMQMEAQLLENIATRITFSNILLTLAEIKLPSNWITKINIDESGNVVELTGNSLSMPDLKLYFTQIENNPYFKNAHVTINSVEHKPKDNYPDFQTYMISIAKTQNEKSNS